MLLKGVPITIEQFKQRVQDVLDLCNIRSVSVSPHEMSLGGVPVFCLVYLLYMSCSWSMNIHFVQLNELYLWRTPLTNTSHYAIPGVE